MLDYLYKPNGHRQKKKKCFILDIDPPGLPENLTVSSLKWTKGGEYQQCELSWLPPSYSVVPIRKYKVFISVRDGQHVYQRRHVVPAVSCLSYLT